MKRSLSIGKLRGLQHCTSSSGAFTCLALDHRQNLRRALNPSEPQSVSDKDLTQFKLQVTGLLASAATAVLLDPEYSAAQAIAQGAIPGSTGLVVAVEATGYGGEPTARQSRLLPGWSIAKAKRMGASMVKLLVYYHPDSPAASEIEAFVQSIVEDCQVNDLALMLEPLSYSLDPQRKTLSSAEKCYVVVETARRLTRLGVDILKAEFPLDITEEAGEENWLVACAEITSASQAPWILLSAAADFDTYKKQVNLACQAGASGIAVGRAVWQDAVALSGQERLEFLRTTAYQRLYQLADLCATRAVPYTEYFPVMSIPASWYKTY